MRTHHRSPWPRRWGGGLAPRLLAPVAAVVLGVSLMGATTGPGPDGQLNTSPSQRPAVQAVAKVPHTTVAMKTLPPMAKPAAATPTAATWPAAGDATVSLATAAATLAPQTAGSLPIVITPTATKAQAAVAGSERVHLADQGSARAAGVTGLLFSITPTTPGTAFVGVNYSAFRNAIGADWGSRLRLVAMPACALTTPTVRACQVQTPVPSTNDTKSDVVSATVAQPASGVVLAAVAGPAGPNGAFPPARSSHPVRGRCPARPATSAGPTRSPRRRPRPGPSRRTSR